jgi:hypothetical protein
VDFDFQIAKNNDARYLTQSTRLAGVEGLTNGVRSARKRKSITMAFLPLQHPTYSNNHHRPTLPELKAFLTCVTFRFRC